MVTTWADDQGCAQQDREVSGIGCAADFGAQSVMENV